MGSMVTDSPVLVVADEPSWRGLFCGLLKACGNPTRSSDWQAWAAGVAPAASASLLIATPSLHHRYPQGLPPASASGLTVVASHPKPQSAGRPPVVLPWPSPWPLLAGLFALGDGRLTRSDALTEPVRLGELLALAESLAFSAKLRLERGTSWLELTFIRGRLTGVGPTGLGELESKDFFTHTVPQRLAQWLTEPAWITLAPPGPEPTGMRGHAPLSVLASALALLPEPARLRLLGAESSLEGPPELPPWLEPLLPRARFGRLFFVLATAGHPDIAIAESGLTPQKAQVALALARLAGVIFPRESLEERARRRQAPWPDGIEPEHWSSDDEALGHPDLGEGAFEDDTPSGTVETGLGSSPTLETDDGLSVLADDLRRELDSVAPGAREPARPEPAAFPLKPLSMDWTGPLPTVELSRTLPPRPAQDEQGRVPGTRLEPLWAYEGPFFLGFLTGKGGLGEQLLGVTLRERVAIKRLLPALAGRADLVELFRTEARESLRLRHPAIVQVVDLVMVGASPYLVSELTHGLTVAAVGRALLARKIPAPPWLVALVGAQVASALAYGVAINVSHGDVAPGNVLLTFAGEVKLAGFGVASASRRKLPGKVTYTAPERLSGAPSTSAADVFSLGALLFELLTGQPLLEGSSLKALRPDLPKAMAGVLEACLDPQPERRPTSAALAATLGEHDQRARVERLLEGLYPGLKAREEAALAAMPLG